MRSKIKTRYDSTIEVERLIHLAAAKAYIIKGGYSKYACHFSRIIEIDAFARTPSRTGRSLSGSNSDLDENSQLGGGRAREKLTWKVSNAVSFLKLTRKREIKTYIINNESIFECYISL